LNYIVKIISLALFLISGLIWKKILNKSANNYHFILYRSITTILFFLLIGLWLDDYKTYLENISSTSFLDWLFALIIGLFSFWGLYLISICIAILTYNEAFKLSKFISLLLIISGIVYHQRKKIVKFSLTKEILLIVISSIIWGVSFVLYLIPIKKIGVFNFSVLLEFCVIISCIALTLHKEKKIFPKKISVKEIYYCILMGFLVGIGSYLSNLSLLQFPVSFNILIGLGFEIITLVVGLIYYKEILYRSDWILIIIATISSFLMII
jgi:hypothetical protein